MGGRGSTGSIAHTPSVADRILSAFEELVNRPGGTVRIADLRDRLASVDKAEFDRTLVEMDRQRKIALDPDPYRAGLTSRDRKAAVNLGGQDMHLIRVR